jgi:hypothetical protein
MFVGKTQISKHTRKEGIKTKQLYYKIIIPVGFSWLS